MTDSESEKKKDLAEILTELNLLHSAQIELAVADQQMSELPLHEVLLVRGWITEAKLQEIAPWLLAGTSPGQAKNTGGSTGAAQDKPQGKVESKSEAKVQQKQQSNKQGSQQSNQQNSQQNSQQSNQQNSQQSNQQEKAIVKPEDLPKEPPQRASNGPAVIESPVPSENDQNLKAYKEMLRKVLAVDKD